MWRGFMLAATLVLATSCADAEDVEIADVNARNALSQASALRDRVSELETQVKILDAQMKLVIVQHELGLK